MMGVDPGKATVDDVFWGKFEDQDEESKKSEKRANALNSSSLIDRMEFLKLLVRVRRVILQDAVVFMKPHLLSSRPIRPQKNGDTLTNSLLTSMPHVFESEMFLYFSNQLEKAIEEHRSRPSLVDFNVPLNTRTLINTLNNLAIQVSLGSTERSLMHDMHDKIREMPSRLEQIEMRLRDFKEEFHELFQEQQRGQDREAEQSKIMEIHRLHREVDQIRMRRMHASNSSLCQPTFPSMDNRANVHRLQDPSPQQSPLLQLQLQPQPQPQPQQSSSSPSPLQQQDQRQQRQEQEEENEHLSSSETDERTKGYLIMPDNGLLTLKKVWNEFRGPIQQASRQDKKWPYTEARKKAYRRRKTLIKLIQSLANKQDQNVETFVDALSTQYKDKTINWIRQELEKANKDKGKGKDV